MFMSATSMVPRIAPLIDLATVDFDLVNNRGEEL